MNFTPDELAALIAVAKQGKRAAFGADAVCIGPDGQPFRPQHAAITSTARRKVLCCSRRAGKSVGIAVGLLTAVLQPPFTNVFYVTLTLKNAKRIIWGELKRLNAEYDLGGVPDDQEGVLKFPKLGYDVHVYLGGVKDAGEIEKVRGPKAKLYVIDEAQSFPPRLIAPLLKDAINPVLLDNRGSLWVSGTPGPLRAGYFWDVCHGSLSDVYERHGWTWRENPHIQPGRSRAEIEEEILAENKLSRESPTYKREWCGDWFEDVDALVFKFDAERNGFTDVPEGKWSYVLGVDIGFEDADAIAVLGWREHDPAVYVVEEYVRRKSSITELAERIQELRDKYQPVKIVADFGGLGKKIGDEIRRRFSLPVEAADKVRKFEHIELLNDAMRTGKFKARNDGPFAEDARIVQWDQDARARGQLKIADDYHSDITDAVLYGFRAAKGFKAEPVPVAPSPEGERLEQARIADLERRQSQDIWDRDAEALGWD